MVDVDGFDDERAVRARWNDFGEWQRFYMEKAPDEEKLSRVLATVARASRLSTAPIIATPQCRRRRSISQTVSPLPTSRRKRSISQVKAPLPRRRSGTKLRKSFSSDSIALPNKRQRMLC